MRKPFSQCFWVHDGLLCAGCYPGDPDPERRDAKLQGLLDCGIRQVLSLMEANEKSHGGRPFEPYVPRLLELAAERNVVVECRSLPIRDASAPNPPALRAILDVLETALREQTPTYLHCWGGPWPDEHRHRLPFDRAGQFAPAGDRRSSTLASGPAQEAPPL
jgi:hypothetical protein